MQNYSTRAKNAFVFAFVFFALFALRRLVDDYDLGDVSVFLFTVQLCCACTHSRTFFLDTDVVVLQVVL